MASQVSPGAMEAGTKQPAGGVKAAPAAKGVGAKVRFGAGLVLTIVWLVCAWLVWPVALGGLCVGQARCTSHGVANNVFTWAQRASLPLISCQNIFRFDWFVLIYDLVVLVMASICLTAAGKYLATSRVMLVGFLAVGAVLSIISTNHFNDIRSVTYELVGFGGINTAARVGLAGFLLLSFFFLLLLYMIGVDFQGYGVRAP